TDVDRSSNPAQQMSKSISLDARSVVLHGTISGSSPRISAVSIVVISAILRPLSTSAVQIALYDVWHFLRGCCSYSGPSELLLSKLFGFCKEVNESLNIINANGLIASKRGRKGGQQNSPNHQPIRCIAPHPCATLLQRE